MKTRKSRIFAADFETTVFDGQTRTDVWSAAIVELFHDDVTVLHSIGDFLRYVFEMDAHSILYFHNLKFDGAFIIDYLLTAMGFEQALIGDYESNTLEWAKDTDLKHKQFKYSISAMGQWYSIKIRWHKHLIEIRDSLKLLPFTLKSVGEAFKTEHHKLDMEYKGFRYPGCPISDAEMHYIKNDVLVLKEALETLYREGHTKLTIGSCCLSEFKRTVGPKYYKENFINLYDIDIDSEKYGVETAGDYIHKGYRGGWCYVVPGKTNKLLHDGCTADVNSLYPYVMHSASNNKYPIGPPTFWKGDYIPREAQEPDKFYYVRLRCRFKLKPGYLPFIQIKNSFLYKGTEMLETSDIWDKRNKCYIDYYTDFKGERHPAVVTLTMTMTDYALLLKHYELTEFEILDGCYFDTVIGIFDEYIDKYKEIKMNSTGAVRTLAKLFSNNLYGKMASSPDSSFKVAQVKDDGSLGFFTVKQSDKLPGYIPIGAAITSYARCYTITAAQANYNGPDAPGFIYADTDSIHVNLPREALQGIEEDGAIYGKWKIESEWSHGIFVRQKTYIEKAIKADGKPLAEPEYIIKCAGMPERCKELLISSFTGVKPDFDLKQYEVEFISKRRKMTDFKVGITVPGKLLPRRIPGGVLLTETTFIMH